MKTNTQILILVGLTTFILSSIIGILIGNYYIQKDRGDYYRDAMLIYCDIAHTEKEMLEPEMAKYNITLPKLSECNSMVLSWDKGE